MSYNAETQEHLKGLLETSCTEPIMFWFVVKWWTGTSWEVFRVYYQCMFVTPLYLPLKL